MAIEFSRIPFALVKASFPLIKKHWEEVVTDDRKLNPDWASFERIEQAGMLRCFGAEHDGELVGYTVFLLHRDLHALDSLMAHNDAVYLSPTYRKKDLGRPFLQYCEDELKKDKDGVDMVIWHVKPSVDYSPLLGRMGYATFSTLYAKPLR